jgi:hypothetical protein
VYSTGNPMVLFGMVRPSKYDAVAVATGVSDYVSQCKSNNYLPCVEGLAVHLGVWRSTLYDWADPESDVYHEEFQDVFEQLRAAQDSPGAADQAAA